MKKKYYLNDLGMINALGAEKPAILSKLLKGSREGLSVQTNHQGAFTVAKVFVENFQPLSPEYENRQNRLLAVACDQIRPTVEALKAKYGTNRIGVVVGSTDNGSEQSLEALKAFSESGAFPENYCFFKQEAHHSSVFVKEYLGTGSVACNISTACTSSARAIVYAKTMLDIGICDAVIAGGGDIVSESVLLGFHSLEAVDRGQCNPFSRNRKGINLGEGAALFVMTLEPSNGENIYLNGLGESSDAYHMTAPDPEGKGAEAAMKKALASAGLNPDEIDYINLHGTGTELNDRMESSTTARVFSGNLPCSSTKQMVGHTLGAAGAMELGFCWLIMTGLNKDLGLPPHLWDGEPEENIEQLKLLPLGYKAERLINCMSNSYAFGGCNVSLIISRDDCA